MSRDKPVEVIYADFFKMSPSAESCCVCSTKVEEYQFTTSKKKAGIFFSSSGEVITDIKGGGMGWLAGVGWYGVDWKEYLFTSVFCSFTGSCTF